MRLSTRRLLSLFLAAMLVAGQWAGQLHALSHAEHDLAAALAVAGSADSAEAGTRHKLPTLDHSADHCVAFHALDSAAADTPLANFALASACVSFAQHKVPPRPAEPLPFSSRAPPVSLS